jgi:hypothetical protein
MMNRGGTLVADHHFENWGLPKHELLTGPFRVQRDGRYVIRATYSNGMPINTGITCGIKVLELLEAPDEQPAGRGFLIMPHSGGWERWAESSPLCFQLQAGKAYRLRIHESEYSRNMSYLEKNEHYTFRPGGGKEGYNFVNITSVHIDLLSAAAQPDAVTGLPAD